MDGKIEIQEWREGCARFDWYVPEGPIPAVFRPRIDELAALFTEAYTATRRHSVVPRTDSISRCRTYRLPDGTEYTIENRTYEKHL